LGEEPCDGFLPQGRRYGLSGEKNRSGPPFFVLKKTSGVLSFPTGCLPEISLNHYIFVFLP
jgi:hypothetical protein